MKNIYLALSKAQAEIQNIAFDSSVQVKTNTGGSYSFEYATLGQIMSQIRPILAKYELAIYQTIEENKMMTVITHSSGEQILSRLPMPTLPPEPQKCGSIISYFRRYGLNTALNLVSEEDDDGNVAEGNQVKKTNKPNSTYKKYKVGLFTGTKNDKQYFGYREDGGGVMWLDGHTYDHLKAKQEKGLSIEEDLKYLNS
jgi:hypothetical protein